jgi:hypothetical protein
VEVVGQDLQQLPRQRWQAPVLRVGDHGQQLPQAGPPLGGDDPELGQLRPQGVDRRRPLLEELLAHPVQHQQRLLVLALDRHEPHPGAPHRLAAGLGVRRVVLVRLHVRPDVLRRHQPHLVTELRQLPRPVVSGGARLEADEAGRQVGEELEHLLARQPALEHRPALGVGAVDLEEVLGEVEADGRDLLHLGCSPCWWSLHHFHAGTSVPQREVAVGTAIAGRPPHRSRRAGLPHRAPTSDG